MHVDKATGPAQSTYGSYPPQEATGERGERDTRDQ